MLGRRRFDDLLRRQLDLFEADEEPLLREAEEADAAWTHASREEAEELYGDYQLVVDAIAERLLDVRETYASSLDERTADGYRSAFNRAALKLYTKALLQKGEHRYLEALRTLEEARRLDPKAAGIQKNLGLLHHLLDQTDEALASYREATRLDPADGETWFRYAQLLRLNNQHKEAINALSHAAEADSLADRILALKVHVGEAPVDHDRLLRDTVRLGQCTPSEHVDAKRVEVMWSGADQRHGRRMLARQLPSFDRKQPRIAAANRNIARGRPRLERGDRCHPLVHALEKPLGNRHSHRHPRIARLRIALSQLREFLCQSLRFGCDLSEQRIAFGLIRAHFLDRYGLQELEVSERDLLHGAALEAAELPEPQEGDAPPGAYTCC